MSKPTKAEVKANKAKKKSQRVRTVSRLLFFIFAVGSIASTVILTMLLSDNELQTAMNVVAGLNSASATYFVLKLIFE